MKRIFTILFSLTISTLLMSQNYTQEWKDVDNFCQKQLPKSAYEKVNFILQKATKEKNQEQIVKAVIYAHFLSSQLENTDYENALVLEIKHLEQSLAATSGSAKSILQSYLAERYTNYVQQNQYELSNRASTDVSVGDIQEWSVENFTTKIQRLYIESIDNKENKKVSLPEFKNIIENSNSIYIPNLYDFLLYRAIEGMTNESNYLTEPVHSFKVAKEFLVPMNNFVKLKIETKDSLSNKYQVLKWYQDLIAEHIHDVDPTILIHIDLRRIQFLFNNYHESDATTRKEAMLKAIYEQYKAYPQSYYAQLELCQLKLNEGRKYNAENTPDSLSQWKIKEYLQCLQSIVNQCKDDNIVHIAQNRYNAIFFDKNYSLLAEEVNLPNEPIMMKISYHNTKKLYYKIVSVDKKYDARLEAENEYQKIIPNILKNKVVSQGEFQFQDLGDFQTHATEVCLPALNLGQYYIVFSYNENFVSANNYLQALKLTISNIAAINIANNNSNAKKLIVVHRQTGEPIVNAKVDYYQYDWSSNRRIQNWLISHTSDEKGMVEIPTIRHSIHYNITYQNDYLSNPNDIFYYFTQPINSTSEEYYLFTDRTIYRPGQTIYFKGIALSRSSDIKYPKILPNQSVKVVFKDANWQDIQTLQLMTNEYGTFQGTLTAPSGGLLGMMTISCNDKGSKSVRVEEYKRPTFEVKMDTFRGTPLLGQEVLVQGRGISYSGAPISNAKIQYTVTRKIRYPYWKCWWMPIPTRQQVVAQGTINSNEAGNFTIPFTAIPDDEDANNSPIYNYEVNLDMSDINGESHSASTSISVSNLEFEIMVNIPTNIDKKDSIKWDIDIRNINGVTIEKPFKIEIEKLVDPYQFYIQRLWSKPDIRTMSETEFKTKFPSLPYINEDNIQNFKPLSNVWSQSYNSKDIVNLSTKKWKSGAYHVKISVQDNKQKWVEIDRYFQLIDDNTVDITKPLTISNQKKEYNPGEQIHWTLRTPLANPNIFWSIGRYKDQYSHQWNQKQLSTFHADVSENDRGGMVYTWMTIYHNRFYQGSESIIIPFSNKKLDIEYSTFRDKLLPNEKETFKLKIKKSNGEKIMAEVLTSMYDMSLDVISEPNLYSLDLIFNGNSLYNNYTPVFFNSKSVEYTTQNLVDKNYPHYDEIHIPYPLLLVPVPPSNRRNRYAHRGIAMAMKAAPSPASPMADLQVMEVAAMAPIEKNKTENIAINSQVEQKPKPKEEPISIRKNLKETVFFYPNLQTDNEGNVLISFQMNEALTKWKMLTLATTKDIEVGYSERTLVTQKELMVTPNAPRFMRVNDKMSFKAKIANLSDKPINGTAQLILLDAMTLLPVSTAFKLSSDSRPFSCPTGQTTVVSWDIEVPDTVSALTYRVIATAGNKSDGEENTIPILPNHMLVTETMPMTVRSNTTKQFDFKEMAEKMKSTTLRNKNFKFEFTSNPVWYAIQSLPYLMEYPYECSEQMMNRYFSNSISRHIIEKYPKIQAVFNSWKSTNVLQSTLSKNQELKSALLEETPWVLQSQSEAEQRKNIALLFDLNKIANEEKKSLDILVQRQLSNGAFSWFPGGVESPYITQYIVEQFGHLQALGIKDNSMNTQAETILNRAIGYIDQKIVRHYQEMERMVKLSKGSMSDDHLDAYAIHYLYTRSYFSDEIPGASQKVIQYYTTQAEKYWNHRSLYEQGMIALYGSRTNRTKLTTEMMKSFRERAKVHEEKGMYWDQPYGYWWYQLPIETHCMMMEVFDKLSSDQTELDNLKIWLLKNKQTNSWNNSKSTAVAIYSLLGSKESQLQIPQKPIVTIAGKPLDIDTKTWEQGLGYFDHNVSSSEITSSLADIKITNPNANIAWGAAYWQYEESLNKIKLATNTPLRVEKQLYKVVLSDRGDKLEQITTSNIHLGDRVRMRLILRVDREMEYLHLKDMRAASFEPIDVLSGYQYTAGLAYYRTIRDASMNLFIDHITPGTYTVEYDMMVNNQGQFSNGIATFQSMYSPEYSSHSSGTEVIIR